MSANVANELVQRARAQDEDAWEQLYEHVYPRLLAFSNRRVGQDRGAEMVAETMARAVASIEQFDDQLSGFDPWVFGICRNVIRSHQRREYRDRRHAEPVPVPDGETGEALERGEEAAAILAAYRRLSADDQELLDLRVIAGLSVRDVANVLGKQTGAIRMAQLRALERLRVNFKAEY